MDGWAEQADAAQRAAEFQERMANFVVGQLQAEERKAGAWFSGQLGCLHKRCGVLNGKPERKVL